jgi:sec-independent protein translocase protein TatB
VFGLSFDKILVIGVVAIMILGPQKLPYYATQLAKLVKNVRTYANGASQRMREEMGPDFDDIDWKKLDPRQYDPRRIIREALFDPDAEYERPVQDDAVVTPVRRIRDEVEDDEKPAEPEQRAS